MNKHVNQKFNNRVKSVNKRKQQKKSGNKNSLKQKTTFQKTIAPVSYGYKSQVKDQKGGLSNIRRKEYVMDVNPKSAKFKKINESDGAITALAELAGNIGLTSSFPWLSSIAPGFEQFIFNACNFLFKPSAPTSTNGSISLVPMYDSARPFPSEKSELLNNTGTSRSPVWAENKCVLDPKKLNSAFKSHKIRDSGLDDNEDIKTTDPYKLGIYLDEGATNATTSLGELWVEYDVDLKIPKSAPTSKAVSTYFSTFAGSVLPVFTKYGSGSAVSIKCETRATDYYVVKIIVNTPNTSVLLSIHGGNLVSEPSLEVGAGSTIYHSATSAYQNTTMILVSQPNIDSTNSCYGLVEWVFAKAIAGWVEITAGEIPGSEENAKIRESYYKQKHQNDIREVLLEMRKEEKGKQTLF